MTDDLHAQAAAIIAAYRTRGWRIATAESCTGGLVAAALTEIPGSSAVVDRGFVTYSNEAKTEMLGVSADLIDRHGAVSREVAMAMADGALARSHADVAVAITGIAGPDGGSDAKPVGLVWLALATRIGRVMPFERRYGDQRRYGDLGRAEIRGHAVEDALLLLNGAIGRDA